MIGLSAIATLVTPIVKDFSPPKTNSTVVVCPFGLITPSNAAVATARFSGILVVVAVGAKPGATGVSNVPTGEIVVPVAFIATSLK